MSRLMYPRCHVMLGSRDTNAFRSWDCREQTEWFDGYQSDLLSNCYFFVCQGTTFIDIKCQDVCDLVLSIFFR